MEVYVESLATKGRKQLDRLLTGVDQVTLKLPQMVTVDSSQVKRTQDTMGSPKRLVFACQHNAVDAGMNDKVGGHDHCKMVDFDRFECTAVYCSQRSVAQNLGIPVGIVVVGIAPAMVVKPCSVALY